jgi:hypothetical protein
MREEKTCFDETPCFHAHPIAMGRDELNLVEFPLAMLADRVPQGCKTLVFEDRIWDRGQRQHVARRLTISASDKFGLPTALDDEVILGLVQLSKASGFANRQVPFSRYQLVNLLGWREEGKSYVRLEESLKRWLGVTLYYENAWWDKLRKRWVDAHFHLLDNVTIYHRPKGRSSVRVQDADNPLSTFTWNDIVFQSFHAGYLKQIDMNLYRGLKLATAKRMYRFLDKRFHFSNKLQFELRLFAHEHIGLSRNYDSAQLKRRLNPAISELENAGFLVSLPAPTRYSRERRGEWQVVFLKKPKERRLSAMSGALAALEKELTMRGVNAITACRLVRNYSEGSIREKIDVYDQLRTKNDPRISKNPAGYLVQSIRHNYAVDTGQSNNSPVNNQNSTLQSPRWHPTTRSDQATIVERKKIRRAKAYMKQLSDVEVIRLEADALAQSPRHLVEGYWRTKESNNSTAFQDYRQQILASHIDKILNPCTRQENA